MLELRLLGQFDIRIDGEGVKVASRQAQALLAYLALHAGKAQRREKLSGIIWPDATEENGRTYLRQALWRLRKAIGETYLTADRMTIAFDPAGECWIDAIVLEREPAEGWTADSLTTAVAVYEGDLLPGFYDEWAVLERERYQALYNRRMDALLKALIAESRWLDLLTWGERWIAAGGAPEPAFRGLMIGHAAGADLTSMTAVYRRCVEALEAELGVEPSEETQALFKQLSRGELPEGIGEAAVSKAAVSPAVEVTSPPAFMEKTADSPEPEPLFIGREKELALLLSHLEQALAGRGQVVFITGEAGQGKTTLVQEFARQAQAQHPALVVASGACPVYTPVCAPYGLFREVLKMLSGDVEGAWSAGTVSREQARRLWALLPDVLDSLTRHSPHLINALVSGVGLVARAKAAGVESKTIERLQQLSGQAENGRDRLTEQGALFAEYADFLIALSQQQPILIILDDLHWADASSIGLLGHLGHRLSEGAIFVVGAYRPEEVIEGRDEEPHPLTPVLNEYKRRHGQVVVALDEAAENGRSFIDTLLDREANALDDDFRAAFTRHTGGHPLFTIELLREMQERGALVRNEAGEWVLGPNFDWDVVPPRVEGVIETRLSHLDQELRQWLELASVEGKAFTAEVIADILNLDTRRVVNRMSRELDRQHNLVTVQGIQQVGGMRQSHYQFRHHLFQQYLYKQLDDIERSYLHQQVGEALERLFGGQTAEIADLLAHHFQMAGDGAKAVRYLAQAGDFAAQVYAFEEAHSFYEQGLALAKEGDGRIVSELFLKLGRILEHNGDAAGAVAVYEEMAALGRAREDKGMLLKALAAQGTQYAIPSPIHDPKKSQQISEEAINLAREAEDKTAEARILWNLMTALEYDNQVSQGIEFGEQSLALARELDDQRQLAYTLNDLAGCYWVAGQIAEAKTLFEEAVGIWRQQQNKPMLTDALFSFSLACMFAGDFDEAIALTDEAWAVSRSVKNIWGLAMSRSRIGFVHQARGELGKGIEAMEASFRMGREHGLPIPQSVTGAELAFNYAYLGATELGLEIAETAMAVANEQTPSHRPFILAAMAQNHLVNGNLDEAAAALEQARSDPYWQAFPVYCIAPVLVEVRLAVARGEYGRALEIGQPLLAQLREFGVRAYLPELLDVLGQASARLDPREEAVDYLLAGKREAEAMGAKGQLWPVLLHLSELVEDEAETAELRQEAREIIEFVADNCGREEFRASFLGMQGLQTPG